MTRSSRELRPLTFDALLWEVIDAPPEDVAAILARCPDREVRVAVLRTLERDWGGPGGAAPAAESAARDDARDRRTAAPIPVPRDAGNRRRIRRSVRYFCFIVSLLGVLATVSHAAGRGAGHSPSWPSSPSSGASPP